MSFVVRNASCVLRRPIILFNNFSSDNEAKNDVHSLIKSHAIGQAFPHLIPNELISESEIAQWSFVKFGNRAYFATYDNIIDTVVSVEE